MSFANSSHHTPGWQGPAISGSELYTDPHAHHLPPHADPLISLRGSWNLRATEVQALGPVPCCDWSVGPAPLWALLPHLLLGSRICQELQVPLATPPGVSLLLPALTHLLTTQRGQETPVGQEPNPPSSQTFLMTISPTPDVGGRGQKPHPWPKNESAQL